MIIHEYEQDGTQRTWKEYEKSDYSWFFAQPSRQTNIMANHETIFILIATMDGYEYHHRKLGDYHRKTYHLDRNTYDTYDKALAAMQTHVERYQLGTH